MLSISLPIKDAGKGDYYLELAREDYYLTDGEPHGLWHGGGANFLALPAQVKKEEFRNLLLGFSPDGRVPCVQNAGGHRQCGWDFTFNAPKTVSVLWSQADPGTREQVERLHQNAVHHALDYLEATGGQTRRGKGGKTWEATPCFSPRFSIAPRARKILTCIPMRFLLIWAFALMELPVPW